jgi:hypothetical protein
MAEANLEFTSRRDRVKGAGVALAALAVPTGVIAATQPDPIFGLIEAKAVGGSPSAFTTCGAPDRPIKGSAGRPAKDARCGNSEPG